MGIIKLLGLAVLFVTTSCVQSTNKPVQIDKNMDSILINLRDSEHLIIIWETESFVFEVKEKEFKEFMKLRIGGWDETGSSFNNKLNQLSEINWNAYLLADFEEKQMLEMWTSELYALRSEVIIRNKRTNKVEKDITIREYSNVGTSGKLYFIRGEKLFRLIETVY